MAKRTLHDRYFRQAKREGYLARSAYKLLEIDDRFRIIKWGGRVLDLGCAPGSWLQVAAQRVGDRGTVVGIDLKPVVEPMPACVRTIVGDFTEIDPAEIIGDATRGFGAIISDMAPNTSGHGDHFRSVRLCEAIVERTPELLLPGGALCMKVFDGETLADLLRQAKCVFGKVSTFKPKASRDVSKETYVVARGFRPPKREPEHAEPAGAEP